MFKKKYSIYQYVCIFIILSIFLTACVIGDKQPTSKSKSGKSVKKSGFNGKTEVGMASWYGSKFHGRPTASGEIFEMDDLTAAHKKIPLGTWAYVTHLENGRTVLVKINDRGPFVDDRVIDLSLAAAKEIGMISDGTAHVRVKVIGEPGSRLAKRAVTSDKLKVSFHVPNPYYTSKRRRPVNKDKPKNKQTTLAQLR